MRRAAGDSSEQQEAGKWLVDALSKKLGVTLTRKRWVLDEGSWIELDGFCQSPVILCEAWAHIGPPKSAQKHKVMTDAFKLLFVSAFFVRNGQRILLFADHDAAAHFQGRSWMARCLSEYDIRVEVIELPPELKAKVVEAQQRQFR